MLRKLSETFIMFLECDLLLGNWSESVDDVMMEKVSFMKFAQRLSGDSDKLYGKNR